MNRKRLGDILLETGVINNRQLNEAMQLQKTSNMRVGEALVKLNYVKEEAIIQTLSRQLDMPSITLSDIVIDSKTIDLIPYSLALQYKLIPFKIDNGVLCIATSNPFLSNGLDDVKFITKMDVKVFLASNEEILKSINKYYDKKNSSIMVKALKEEFKEENYIKKVEISEKIKDAPTVKIVEDIITRAIKEQVSDIHIEPFQTEVIVRYRIDGELNIVLKLPISSYSAISTRIKVLCKMNIAENRLPQDGRLEMTVEDKKFDLRVSSLPTIFGEKLVLRILNQSSIIMQREHLGFSEEENKLMDKFQTMPYGIVLVSGPTGSGKTTTLYTLLKEKNKPSTNIVTVEDPVEYMFKGINQVQINPKAGLSFAKGLRSILRQDPDIIMVGEIRDEETANIAVRAAITGHLVLSTIHTNDAASTITRMIDMGVPRYLVADALVGIVAQRLVRKLCPFCKEISTISHVESMNFSFKEGLKIYEATGCPRCNHTGYIGRTAVHEVFNMTKEIKQLVNEGASSDKIKDKAMELGMMTLRENCKELVIKGQTSLEELVKVAYF